MFLTLLPAPSDTELVRVDWSRAVAGETDITALRGEYVSAVNARDIDRASDLYTSDALAMLDDGMVRGAQAIGRRLTGLTSGASVTLVPQRISSAGNVASETGTFTETLSGPNGVSSVEGVYVTIYSRIPNGGWRIALEVRTTGRWPALAVW
jgi:ketosteroid isomerase-like protein